MAHHRTVTLLFLHLSFLSAWAYVELTAHEENIEVLLDDSARIPCHYSFDAFSYPEKVHIQWFARPLGNTSRTRIFYTDNNITWVDLNTTYSNRISVSADRQGTNVLTVNDIQLSDQHDFICQINGLAAGHIEGRTRLSVLAPPEVPTIEAVQTPLSVSETLTKVASCEARHSFPKSNITWYRNNKPLYSNKIDINVLILVTLESSGLYSVQSTLELKVKKEDKDAVFSCEVSFFTPGEIRRFTSSSVNITVHYPSTMMELWKESPPGLVKEGDTVELRCQGDGQPPLPMIFNKEQEQDVELDSSGNTLILPAVTRRNSGSYQCREKDADRNVKGEMQLTVHYLDPPVMVPRDSEVMSIGENLTATCNALSSLNTSTLWYKDGKLVGKGNTLYLQDANYMTAGEYVCEVAAPVLPALHMRGSVDIIVQGSPQLVEMVPEVKLEEEEGRMVNLTCKAYGYPLPSFSWNIAGSKTWFEVENRANKMWAQSTVSVRVTSDVIAICNMSNNLGSDVKLFTIKAIPMATSTTLLPNAEANGMIIVVIILCLLLLAITGSVLYFLYKKFKLPCGRSGKKYITREETTKDDIVVEMKSNTKNEDAVLLKAVSGDNRGPNEQ